MTIRTEQSNLLNPSTQQSFLPEKIVSGLGTLGSLAAGGFLGLQISKEDTVEGTGWVAIGSLTALLGLSVFCLARAFQHSTSPVAELSSVAIVDDEDTSNLDLNQITQKITLIANKIPNPKNQTSSIQENTTLMDQLTAIHQCLTTQNKTLKTSQKENTSLQSQVKALKDDLKKTNNHNSSQSQINDLQIQLKQAQEKLTDNNLEIESLQTSLTFYSDEIVLLKQKIDIFQEENTESSQGFDEIRSLVTNLITSNSRSNSTQPSPYKTFSLPTTPITHHRSNTRRTPTCTPTKLTFKGI
jgi:hypothetical protein